MKKIIFLILTLATTLALHAQVAINTDNSSPDGSAMLDVKSTSTGMLVPRMTTTQRAGISSPANGLLVYDITTNSFWYYQNGIWTELRAGNITALSDADNDTKITTGINDDDIIRFYSKNGTIETFHIDSNRLEPVGGDLFIGRGTGGKAKAYYKGNTAIGNSALSSLLNGYGGYPNSNDINGNTAVGEGALKENIFGSWNTAIGNSALYFNKGHYNNAFGSGALGGNTIGGSNVACGSDALRSNTEGNYNVACGNSALYSNTYGNDNVACGSGALQSNTEGDNNTATGNDALSQNTTGYSNVAVGIKALYSNTTSSNLVAVGDSALYHNGKDVTSDWEAIENTAIGSKALFSNTTGNENTASGTGALYFNTTGDQNTAYGYQALYQIIDGDSNTAVGGSALFNLVHGNSNTVIGSMGYPSGTNTYSNYTGIGYYVGTSVANPSNRVEIGNTSVTWIGGQKTWSTYSDERIKDKVRADVPGLAFIMKLNPVTYNLNVHRQNKMLYGEKADKMNNWKGKYDIEQQRMTGFLAQDVAAAAKALNYEFSGVDIPKNDKDLYSLSYAEFVVPLVKGMQEQQAIIEKQNKEIDKLKQEISKMKTIEQRLENLEKQIANK